MELYIIARGTLTAERYVKDILKLFFYKTMTGLTCWCRPDINAMPSSIMGCDKQTSPGSCTSSHNFKRTGNGESILQFIIIYCSDSMIVVKFS